MQRFDVNSHRCEGTDTQFQLVFSSKTNKPQTLKYRMQSLKHAIDKTTKFWTIVKNEKALLILTLYKMSNFHCSTTIL